MDARAASPITRNYVVTKTFHAPLDFVFAWCTDFKVDDAKMAGSKTRRHFLERSKRRVVYVLKRKKGGETVDGIRAVWIRPPDSWHLDTCGDKRELCDYKLSTVGKRTKLTMTFSVSYDDPRDARSRRELVSRAKARWDAFAGHLERDYAAARASR